MSRAGLLLLALTGCAHLSGRGTQATARLQSLTVARAAEGTLSLGARYAIEGMRFDQWKGASARVTVFLDDVPFAAMVARPHALPGEQLAVSASLDGHLPQQVQARVQRGEPVRVRLRGELELAVGADTLVIPADDELATTVSTARLQPSP